MKSAVLGATGTAGSRVVQRLRARGSDVVEVSRAHGVDVLSGAGLTAALADVDVVVDASNAFPSDDSMALGTALAAATRNVVAACVEQRVPHLVFLSIAGIENPVFDQFEYYVAKRDQEKIIGDSAVPATIVKTTQWHEFATNPAAVTFHDQRVEVQDWLVQPIAADTVAEVLVHEAVQPSGRQRILVTGPERIRLPELARRRLAALDDPRPVQVIEPYLPELARGVLAAPTDAKVLGPNLEEWLATLR